MNETTADNFATMSEAELTSALYPELAAAEQETTKPAAVDDERIAATLYPGDAQPALASPAGSDAAFSAAVFGDDEGTEAAGKASAETPTKEEPKEEAVSEDDSEKATREQEHEGRAPFDEGNFDGEVVTAYRDAAKDRDTPACPI